MMKRVILITVLCMNYVVPTTQNDGSLKDVLDPEYVKSLDTIKTSLLSILPPVTSQVGQGRFFNFTTETETYGITIGTTGLQFVTAVSLGAILCLCLGLLLGSSAAGYGYFSYQDDGSYKYESLDDSSPYSDYTERNKNPQKYRPLLSAIDEAHKKYKQNRILEEAESTKWPVSDSNFAKS